MRRATREAEAGRFPAVTRGTDRDADRDADRDLSACRGMIRLLAALRPVAFTDA